jgi:hypothetical protein
MSLSTVPGATAEDPWEIRSWHWLDHVGDWQWLDASTSAYAWGTHKGIARVELKQDSLVAKLMLGKNLMGTLRATLRDPVTEQSGGATKTTWQATAVYQLYDEDEEVLEGTYVVWEYSGHAYDVSGVATWSTLLVTDEYQMVGLTRATK